MATLAFIKNYASTLDHDLDTCHIRYSARKNYIYSGAAIVNRQSTVLSVTRSSVQISLAVEFHET